MKGRILIFRIRIHPCDKYNNVKLLFKFTFRRECVLQMTEQLRDDIKTSIVFMIGELVGC